MPAKVNEDDEQNGSSQGREKPRRCTPGESRNALGWLVGDFVAVKELRIGDRKRSWRKEAEDLRGLWKGD